MTCSDCHKSAAIVLNDGSKVCNYCPDWAHECLNREQDARRFLAMPRDMAKAEYRSRKASGEDLGKLDSVIQRLKAVN